MTTETPSHLTQRKFLLAIAGRSIDGTIQTGNQHVNLIGRLDKKALDDAMAQAMDTKSARWQRNDIGRYPAGGVMTIADRIEQAAVEFEMTTGLRPHCIYLGTAEWQELKDYAESMFGFGMRDAAAPGRPEFRGRTVFRVSEEHHIGIGARPIVLGDPNETKAVDRITRWA